MGVLDNLLSGWGWTRRGAVDREIAALKAQIAKITGRFPLAYAGGERWNVPDPSVYGYQADLYRQISWIAAAVQILSQSCATVPFNVKRMEGEDTVDVPNHPFEKLMRKPNPMMSRQEFLEAVFGYYRLTGNGYIWVNSANERAEVDEMWVIPSNQVQPVPDGNLYLRGYLYYSGTGIEMVLEPHEVVHLKRFNPNNLFVGLSPIEAIAEQAQGDLGRVKRDSRLYNDTNGRLPGILAFADGFIDEEWDRLKAEVGNKANQMRQFMMLRGVKQGGVQWINTTLSNRDMEFLDNRRFTKEEIYDLFAPGLASMLAVNATEANSKIGKATFDEYARWPMLTALSEKITLDILPRYGDNLIGEFDDIRAKDRAMELQELQSFSLTHTVAEIRKEYYQDDPLGDERDDLFPSQVQATSGQPEPKLQPQPAQLMGAQPEAPAQESTPEDDMQDIENAGDSAEIEAKLADLRRWKRVARKAVKAGKPIPDFVTEAIPGVEQERIRAALSACKSLEEVDAVFEPQPAKAAFEAYWIETNGYLKQLASILGD